MGELTEFCHTEQKFQQGTTQMEEPRLWMDQPWEPPATPPFLKGGLDPAPPSWLFVHPVIQSCGICRRWKMLHKSRLAIWKPQLGSLRLNLKREVTKPPKFNYSPFQSGVHALETTQEASWIQNTKTAGDHWQLSVSMSQMLDLNQCKLWFFLQRTDVRFAVSWEKSCSPQEPEQHPLHLPRWGCSKPQVLLPTCSIFSSPGPQQCLLMGTRKKQFLMCPTEKHYWN